MIEKYRRHFLRTKEAKSVLERASEKLEVDLEQIFKAKANVEIVETEFAEILFINGKPVLVKAGENVFPTLIFNEFLALAPKVVVDMGAVPHVCSGANIMAPGIVRFDGEFRKGDFVLVVDEKHDKPIAVGEILYDVETVKMVSQGVVVRNIHFVGDRIWNFIKKLAAKASES
jgi:PUA domain protein